MCEGPSSISGPIPPDPSLFPQYYKRPASGDTQLHGCGVLKSLLNARTPAQQPRISPSATHILERGQKGVVGELLKLDSVNVAIVPKQSKLMHDFGKENIRRLREIQKRCKEQEAERAQSHSVPVKALWTSSKYQSVPSRVMVQLQARTIYFSSLGFNHSPQCQNFLKAHSHGGSAAPQRPQSKTSHATGQRRASCDSAQDLNLEVRIAKVLVFSIDFIKHNARAAGKTVLRRSQSLTNLKDKTVPSAVKGEVPQYLVERKEQWRKEKEERRRNAPDPTVPAGHTQMPENERQETLKSLKETHRSLVTELLSLPLKADNLSVRSRRAQLDCRLSEIEEAIKIFSRDRVYVKIDS
uniref:Enkurin domain containing 1 n=1 Tax=Amphilophus citrinellus TaxID=61819 RepID=A0A3Q0SFN1_AMPCI